MSDEAVRERLRLYAEDVAPVHLPPFGGVSARRRRRRTQRLLSATSAMVVVALVVVLAAVLGGGSSRRPTATGLSSELIGGRWSLSSITTGGTVWKAPPDNGFSLTFTASGYTGNDSCNATSGTVSYGKDTVHLGSGPMTDMGCVDGDQGRMQEAFRLLLDKDLPAVMSAGTLTITAGQTIFALTRVESAAPVDLSKVLPDTTWSLVSTGTIGKDVASSSSVPATVHANISFGTNDYVASDGCNSHSGQVSYASTTVTFGQAVVTDKLCTGPAGQYGKAFADVLRGSVKPTLVGNTLTLGSATQSLVFARDPSVAVDAPSAVPTGTVVAPILDLKATLTASPWKLLSVKAPAASWHAVAGSTASLTFTATTFQAFDGCGSLEAAVTYDAAAGAVNFPAGGDVRAGACSFASPGPPADSLVPPAFLAAFSGEPMHVSLDADDGLTLSKSGVVLTFTGKAPSPVRWLHDARPGWRGAPEGADRQ